MLYVSPSQQATSRTRTAAISCRALKPPAVGGFSLADIFRLHRKFCQILDDALEKNGVGDYTDIELTFRVYDSDDWLADEVVRETVHVYPYGQDKATVFVRNAQASDTVIIDNEYVTAIVTGYEKDALFGYTVKLFLMNKTEKSVMFSTDKESVNGYMADPLFATSVAAGKCAFSSISWSNSTLEENGITDVETIEFQFRAYNNDNWLADDFANKTVTLNP